MNHLILTIVLSKEFQRGHFVRCSAVVALIFPVAYFREGHKKYSIDCGPGCGGTDRGRGWARRGPCSTHEKRPLNHGVASEGDFGIQPYRYGSVSPSRPRHAVRTFTRALHSITYRFLLFVNCVLYFWFNSHFLQSVTFERASAFSFVT